jgi:hypothetical protein
MAMAIRNCRTPVSNIGCSAGRGPGKVGCGALTSADQDPAIGRAMDQDAPEHTANSTVVSDPSA